MKYWLAIAILGAGTYLYRYSFMGGLFRFQMPPIIKRGLDYVPVSVMAALVSLGFFVGDDKSFATDVPRLSALIAATLLALKFKRDLITIGGGLAVFWVVADYLRV